MNTLHLRNQTRLTHRALWASATEAAKACWCQAVPPCAEPDPRCCCRCCSSWVCSSTSPTLKVSTPSAFPTGLECGVPLVMGWGLFFESSLSFLFKHHHAQKYFLYCVCKNFTGLWVRDTVCLIMCYYLFPETYLKSDPSQWWENRPSSISPILLFPLCLCLLYTHTFSPQWSVSSSQLLIFQLLLSAVKTRNAHASAKNLAMRNLWNWVTWHQTPAHWCVTTVFKPHWALVLHQKTTSPSPTSSPTTFFFYTKIHESLATGVTVRWIKIFIAPFALPEIPSVQLNISERRARSPKVTDNRANAKWNWWAKFSTLCLRNVPCNPLHCVLFFYSVPNPPPPYPQATYVSQQGRGKQLKTSSPFIPRFYVQLRDLLTQFNYGTFPKWH